MRGEAHQQGHLDALCGIYSLVHFIRDKPSFISSGVSERGTSYDIRAKLALRLMLESADKLKLLSADNLVEGFFCFQLKDIFNEFCRYLEMPYAAFTLSSFKRGRNFKSSSQVASFVLTSGGGMVMARPTGHWVLFSGTGRSRTYEVVSSGVVDKERVEPAELDGLDPNLGVVLLSVEQAA